MQKVLTIFFDASCLIGYILHTGSKAMHVTYDRRQNAGCDVWCARRGCCSSCKSHVGLTVARLRNTCATP